MSLKKKILLIIITIISVIFLFFVYKSKPKDYKDINYLVITKFGGDLFTNKYNIEQISSKGLKGGFVVGYSKDGIFIPAYKEENLTTKNYYLAKYILKNNSLIIDEIIELHGIHLNNEKEYAYIVYANKDYLYYFKNIDYLYSLKNIDKKFQELYKYNIHNHKNELIVKLNEGDDGFDYNGKYLIYDKENHNNQVVSIIDKQKKIDILNFNDKYRWTQLIQEKDVLLRLEEDNKLIYYNLESKSKTYIKDLETFCFFKLLDNGEEIIAFERNINFLWLFYFRSPIYYDFFILNIKTGVKDIVHSLDGFGSFMAINLNDYPAFREKEVKKQ